MVWCLAIAVVLCCACFYGDLVCCDAMQLVMLLVWVHIWLFVVVLLAGCWFVKSSCLLILLGLRVSRRFTLYLVIWNYFGCNLSLGCCLFVVYLVCWRCGLLDLLIVAFAIDWCCLHCCVALRVLFVNSRLCVTLVLVLYICVCC